MVRFSRTLAALPLAYVVSAIRDRDALGTLHADKQATSGEECIPELSWCDTGSEKCCTPTEGDFAGQLYQCQKVQGIKSDKKLCQGVYAMKAKDTCPEGHKKCSIYCCEAGFGCSDTGNCVKTKSDTTTVLVKDDGSTTQEVNNQDQDDASTTPEVNNQDQDDASTTPEVNNQDQDVQEEDEPDVDVDVDVGGNQDDGSDMPGENVPQNPEMPVQQDIPEEDDEDAEKPKTYKRHTYRRYR